MQIDLTTDDEATPFHPEEWIGKEKIFPTYVPAFIRLAFDKVFKVPPDQEAFIPKPTCLVSALIQMPLPSQSSSVVNYEAESCFSTDPPNENLDFLMSREVPSKEHIESLLNYAGQAWFDGSQSVKDRRHRHSRFPLWSVTFWDRLRKMLEAQRKWRECKEWIAKQRIKLSAQSGLNAAAGDAILQESESLYTQLQCDVPVNVLGADFNQMSTFKLTAMLTDECLTDGLIDMAIRYLSVQLRENNPIGLYGNVLLSTLAFSHVIDGATEKSHFKTNSPYLLNIYKEILLSEDAPTILTGPFFVRLSDKPGAIGHWVAFRVDFGKSEICYSDSLGTNKRAVEHQMTKLRWWLRTHFKGPFKILGNTMSHGTQHDGFSCGIFTLNAIEHELFGRAICTNTQKGLERANWFNRFAKTHLSSANRPTEEDQPVHLPVQRSTSNTEDVSRSLLSEDHNAIYHLSLRTNSRTSKHVGSNDAATDVSSLFSDLSPTRSAESGSISSEKKRLGASLMSSLKRTVLRSRKSSESVLSSLKDKLSFVTDDADSTATNTCSHGSLLAPTVSASSNKSDSSAKSKSANLFTQLKKNVIKPLKLSRTPIAKESIDGSAQPAQMDAVTTAEVSDTEVRIGDLFSTPIAKEAMISVKENIVLASPTPDSSSESASKPLQRTLHNFFTIGAKKKKPTSDNVSISKENKFEDVKPLLVLEDETSSKKNKTTNKRKRRGPEPKKEVKPAVYDECKATRFLEKARVLDELVELHPDNPRLVRCSGCGEYLLMQEAYKIQRFKEHLPVCPGEYKIKRTGAGTSSLHVYFGDEDNSKKNIISDLRNEHNQPCSGLTADVYPLVDNYLNRTGVQGGGSKSLTELAKMLFRKLYGKLKKKEKDIVITEQVQRQTWKNDFVIRSVFSTACEKVVAVRNNVDPDTGEAKPVACRQCLKLLKDKRFVNAAKRPIPLDERYKYIPFRFRPKGLAEIYSRVLGLRKLFKTAEKEGKTAPIKFAEGVLDGEYEDKKVFVGLVEAMVLSKDKEKRGVGRQNFPYPPAWEDFAGGLCTNSPSTYKELIEELPAPTVRHFQKKRAKSPRFALGITDRNFEDVAKHVESLQYDGPFALSCDDTKLHPAFCPYYDHDRKAFMIIGMSGAKQEISVPNMEALESVVQSDRLTKATKVRVWMLQAEVPKMPPILVAMMAICDDMSAPERARMSMDILKGLIKHKIKVISCSHDGTAVERRTQALIIERYKNTAIKYSIKHPVDGKIDIDIVSIDGQPLMMLQDSKHALKTYRNNLSSGARALILGNHLALFRHLLEMVLRGGPAYPRDVLKADRQDDNAATRIFSSDSLAWFVNRLSTQPELRGMIVYLFVFGELVDAYQSRTMTHLERAEIAIRTMFFMEYWLRFIKSAGYTKQRHCISNDAIDITRMLIQGILGIIFIHRDFCDETSPLLPWLHSSETCEHFFGVARQTVSDFTFGDLFTMLPKLHLKIRLAAVRGKSSSSGKERANGYNHTYFDAGNAKLKSLTVYPSNIELDRAAIQAYTEAQELFFLLGITPAQLTKEITVLPGIESFVIGSDVDLDKKSRLDLLDFSDSDDEESITDDEEIEEYSNAKLMDLLHDEETSNGPFRAHATQKALKSLSFAAASMSLEESMRVLSLPELTDAEREQALEDDRDNLQRMISECRQLLPDERSEYYQPESMQTDIDFNFMIESRRRHETDQAKKGTRKRARVMADGDSDEEDKSAEEPQESLQAKMFRRFYELTGQSGEQRSGMSGVKRCIRWTNPGYSREEPDPEPDVDSDAPVVTGNAANAATVSSAAARKVLGNRIKMWETAGFPDFGSARISLRYIHICPTDGTAPLASSFGFVCVNEKIMLAKVWAMYKKGGGKAGRHSDIQKENNIAAISYLVVQVYELMFNRRFRATPEKLASLNAVEYMHLPSNNFLCVLDEVPKDGGAGSLIIGVSDFERFSAITEARGSKKDFAHRRVAQCIVNLNRRARNDKSNEVEGGEEMQERI